MPRAPWGGSQALTPQKGLGGPSCAAEVLRPGEQTAGATGKSHPQGGEAAAEKASARAGTGSLFSMCLEPGRSFLG